MELYKLFFLIHKRTDFVAMYRFQREVMLPEEYSERYRHDLDHKHFTKLAQLFGVINALSMGLENGFYLE